MTTPREMLRDIADALVELGFDPEEEIARKMATNKTRGPRG